MMQIQPLLAELNGLALGRIVLVCLPLFLIWALIDGVKTARLAQAVEIKAECMKDSDDQEAFRLWLKTNGRKILEAENSRPALSREEFAALLQEFHGGVPRLGSSNDDEGDLGGDPDELPVGVASPLSDAAKSAMAVFSGAPIQNIPMSDPLPIQSVKGKVVVISDDEDEEGGVA